MKKTHLASSFVAVSLLVATQFALAADPEHSEQPAVAPAEAISKLKEGNGRYTGGNLQHPGQTTERRSELAKDQHPFAVIVSCSDSRVPPEIVFDQGLGDLFVVRVAGNVIDDHGLGSIEYAVDHLGVAPDCRAWASELRRRESGKRNHCCQRQSSRSYPIAGHSHSACGRGHSRKDDLETTIKANVKRRRASAAFVHANSQG